MATALQTFVQRSWLQRVLLAAPIAALAVAAWSKRWMSDDGYIYLRVLDQLSAGNGPVFNRGERVEAATSPLWLYMLAATKFVLGPVSTPWLAVILGLLLTLLGLALVQWAASTLWRDDKRALLLPFGSLVIAALPPFWEYSTSGLETGLSFVWLGACFAGLVSLRDHDNLPSAPRYSLCGLIGLGLLIRPDYAVFVVGFMLLYFLLSGQQPWRARCAAIGVALAVPIAYQIFRMGYYAALVPNPAFAKEAGLPRIDQGWLYLWDFFETYWLLVPLAIVVGLALPSWWSLRRPLPPWRLSRSSWVAVIFVVSALFHAAYVVYVGGDFMHGRMLLPAVFAAVAPVAVIAVDTRMRALAFAGVLIWAIVCGTTLRVSYSGIGPHGIANERNYYTAQARVSNPITTNDFRRAEAGVSAKRDLALVRSGTLLLLSRVVVPLKADAGVGAVVQRITIGVYSNMVGRDIYIVDTFGLADPIGGRLELEKRGRPGHEKRQSPAWAIARFVDPDADLQARPGVDNIVAEARKALDCGDIPRLLDAVDKPLTFGRFSRNLLNAFRLHTMRIPAQPSTAALELCK